MFNKIKNYIKTHISPVFTEKPHILVGLSGGPDSVFLLHFLKKLETEGTITLSAAHLNHGWRTEANEEELFCKDLCKKLEIPCFAEHAKNLTIDLKPNGSQEEIGRKLRQHFFKKIKKEQNIDYIALAHHQQDQEETFFIRLIRGASLAGLTAIKPFQKEYIRPLLCLSKQEIVDYLEENNLEYKVDQSNESDNFLRNRIRNHVIPALKGVDPRFSQKFETTLKNLEQENLLLEKITESAFESVFSELIGNQEVFCSLDSILQKRLVVRWLCTKRVKFIPSSGFLEEIIKFISSERGGIHQVHENWAIKKQQKKFWISDEKA